MKVADVSVMSDVYVPVGVAHITVVFRLAFDASEALSSVLAERTGVSSSKRIRGVK